MGNTFAGSNEKMKIEMKNVKNMDIQDENFKIEEY